MIDAEGRRRARMVAQWEIGDPNWADLILEVYFNPESTAFVEAEIELEDEYPRVELTPTKVRRTDEEALDQLNLMLSAAEWPGASGMEDVCAVVRSTGRTEVPDAPTWYRH